MLGQNIAQSHPTAKQDFSSPAESVLAGFANLAKYGSYVLAVDRVAGFRTKLWEQSYRRRARRAA